MISNTKGFGLVLKTLLVILLILFIFSVIKTCSDCARIAVIEKTGYLPDDENWDSIPDIDPPYNPDDIDSLPDAVSIESLFPPIGNQGSYGTCVAWAVGYNMKTALNARENHWDENQLKNPANQTSPKDLWMAIPSMQKGAMCQGTIFEAAFSALQSIGAESMKNIPYISMGNCSGTAAGNPSNKIQSFGCLTAKPDTSNLQIYKAYIRDSIPLVISARIGDRFVEWNSDAVIDHDSYKYRGQHAYHAMVLSGYDDSRNSFRVRNSWGSEWGDNGSIWVDYNFFCNSFCLEIFVGSNK